jgi:hypothetical protein
LERSFDVFVCYHELGASDYAEQIFKTLTERKYSVYVDHIFRKPNRGKIHENIDNIIKNCKIFILLNTIDSLNRAVWHIIIRHVHYHFSLKIQKPCQL